MTRYLHTLSAILFYALGLSMFIAYVLHINEIWADGALRWMLSADLPLLAVGLLYGGLSVYLSMSQSSTISRGVLWTVGSVAGIIFLLSLILKFI